MIRSKLADIRNSFTDEARKTKPRGLKWLMRNGPEYKRRLSKPEAFESQKPSHEGTRSFTKVGRNVLEVRACFKAPTGRIVTAQGNALGCWASNDSSPEGAKSQPIITPFQGLGPRLPVTQGVALGFWIMPRWGFKRNFQNTTSV